jgi:hypothetical protein
MNDLLDITGHFLYIAFSIILLPVFLLTESFIGLLIAIKYVRKLKLKLHTHTSRRKQLLHPLQLKKRLVFARTKFISAHN